MNTTLQVLDNPLRCDRVEVEMPVGLTVAEMLIESGREWMLDEKCPVYITLESDWGVVELTQSECYTTYPAEGETVGVKAIPSGGGGGGKSPIIGIVIAVVALVVAYFVPALAPMMFRIAFAAALGSVSSMLAGAPNLPSQSGVSDNSATSAIYSITGTQNKVNKFGPVPTMIGGKTRVWPTLAAEPYTEVAGEDQYLRQRFAILGPVKMTDFKIGETDINDYDGVELEYVEGWDGDITPTLYADGNDIHEETVQATLIQADGWVTRTTQNETKEISFDINLAQLFQIEGSEYIATSVTFDVSYREDGTSGNWLAPSIGAGSVVSTGDGEATRITIDGYYTNARLFNYIFNVDEGQYDVRWRRITEDHDEDTKIYDAISVYVLRSISEHPGIDTTKLPPMAIIDLRIKASGQLSGVVDQFNFIGEAYLPVWNGSSINYELSSNPAWAYLNVLYGNANKRKITSIDRFDMDGLLSWANTCDANDWSVNGIMDTSNTVFQAMATIASVGRASPSMVNNKYGVAVDWEKDTVVQVFTPRNSWGFEATKTWPDEQHAIRATFYDEESGYELSEGTVYFDGYDENNATLFYDQELQYVTQWEQVWKHCRYQIADRTLRPEIYSFNVDVENLRCTRGDRIRIVHDVMIVGLGQARIKSVTTDGSGNVETATIDSLWTIDTTTDYAINIQRLNGSVYEGFMSNPATEGDYNEITFSPAIPSSVAPSGGELIAFGEADTGVGLDLIIHEIQPGADLTARLVCQDYAPGIQEAASGEIPPYNPQITYGRDSRNGRPNAPTISVVSDESVIIVANDGTLVTRAVISVEPSDSPIPITSIIAQYRRSGSDLWDSAGTYPPDTNSVSIDNLPDGVDYDFRVQASTEVGSTSEWSEVLNHTIVGKTSLPPDVSGALLNGDLLEWTYPNRPVDFAGFRLRYAISGTQYAWSTATPVTGDPLISVQQFDISGFSGSLVWLVKAEDTTGNQSQNPAVVTTNLGDIGLSNVLETWPQAPDWDDGTIINGSVISGVLTADGEDVWTGNDLNVWWSGNDSRTVWGESQYKQMTYTWSQTFEVGGDLTIQRENTDGAYIEFAVDSERQSWSGVDTTTVWTGTDSNSWWDGYGDFAPWVGSIPIDEGDTILFRAVSPSGDVQGKFTTVTPTIDVPDVEETIEDVTISTGGTRLTLTNEYRKIKAIVYGIQDNGLGTTGVRVVDKDVDLGPLLEAETANALIDVRVQGY